MALITKVMQTTFPSSNIIRCDNKNLGLSDLCNFELEEVDPPIWGQDVINEEMKDMRAANQAYTFELDRNQNLFRSLH